jgi:hypothetical protein
MRRPAARTCFVLVPSNYQIDPEAFQQYLAGFDIEPSTVDLDQPNRLLPEALAPFHLKVIDMLTPMRAAHQKGARLFGRVDVHFSPAGHDVAERILEPMIVEMLQEPRAANVHAARR